MRAATGTARLTALQFALVAASVLAAVAPHLWRLPLPIAALILALFVGRCAQRARSGTRIPGWLKLPLVLIFPVVVVFHYGNIFGREPGSALACAMLVLKLVETDARRDARAAICFASFVLMSALLFDSGLGFALLLFASLALFLATLRELEPRAPDAPARGWRRALREDLSSGGVALLGAIPLALCVFVFFPRLGSPLWGAPSDATETRTGLGESMAPGAIQELLIDDSPAFRVSFDSTPPPRADLYWRGPVLWHFDGRAWTRPEYFVSGEPASPQALGAQVSYEVELEPTDRHWLLALDVPMVVPDGAVRGADMSVVSHAPVDSLLRYRATSAPRYRLEQVLDGPRRSLALQLPRGFNPRAMELARQWRSQLGSDDAIIAAALAMFSKDFTYTLNPPLLARDSVDDFLFGEKRGFCEHFSSAFTFLMRAAGIPARVVTGYQGGFFNGVGNYLVVRQSDAHAWSEVWLQGRGWVRVDPTAAVSPERVELGARASAGTGARWYQARWLLALRNQFDLVNRIWNDAIVQFNVLRQQSLLTPFGVDKADYDKLMIVLIGSSSLLLALFAWWTLRAPRGHLDPLDAAYQRLCAKLARAGTSRAATEGPLAFAARVRGAGLRGDGLPALLHQYAILRYACAQPSAAAVRAFARRVGALRVHAPASAAG